MRPLMVARNPAALWLNFSTPNHDKMSSWDAFPPGQWSSSGEQHPGLAEPQRFRVPSHPGCHWSHACQHLGCRRGRGHRRKAGVNGGLAQLMRSSSFWVCAKGTYTSHGEGWSWVDLSGALWWRNNKRTRELFSGLKRCDVFTSRCSLHFLEMSRAVSWTILGQDYTLHHVVWTW